MPIRCLTIPSAHILISRGQIQASNACPSGTKSQRMPKREALDVSSSRASFVWLLWNFSAQETSCFRGGFGSLFLWAKITFQDVVLFLSDPPFNMYFQHLHRLRLWIFPSSGIRVRSAIRYRSLDFYCCTSPLRSSYLVPNT